MTIHTFTERSGGAKAKHSLFAALAASTALGLCSPAFAMDATDFFKAMQAQVEKDGNTMTFGSLEASGSDGARATGIEIINKENGDRLTIGEMELSGTAVQGNDEFSFETMRAGTVKLVATPRNGNAATFTFGSVEAEGFRVIPAEKRENPFWPMEMESGMVRDISLVATGENNISIKFPSFEINNLQQGDGGSFTLGSALLSAGTGTFAGDDGANGTFSLGESSISDAAKIGKSGFDIVSINLGGLQLEGVTNENEEVAISFDGMRGTNVFSPDYETEGDLVFPDDELLIELGKASVSLAGKEVFTMDGGSSKAKYDEASGDYGFSGALNKLYLDIKSIPVKPGNEQGRQQFEALGYEDVTLDVTLSGYWNTQSGIVELSEYKFDAEDMAAFDIKLKLGGYTTDLAKRIQRISSRVNTTRDPEMQQALSMQMLAEMSALSVHELQLKLDDKSLTRRIMAMQAEKSGQSAEDMAAAMPFMVGGMLAQLEVPEFAASVSSAISAYFGSALNDSGSLSISANPDQPVSFAEIMGIAAGVKAGNVKPAEVIDRLNVTIDGK